MANHYFDIETTGLDPARDQIITIQFRDLSTGNYADVMPMILRVWESSEKEVLARFLSFSDFFSAPWKFVPVGFNLDFELRFLFTRAKVHGLLPADARFEEIAATKPRKDLKPVVVLMNGGAFKGASLENFSAKPASGDAVIRAYAAGDYDAILDYIQNEMWGFIRLYARLERDLPRYWQRDLGPDMRAQKEFLESARPHRTVPVTAPTPAKPLARETDMPR